VTPVRTVTYLGVGTALLSVLAGCSSDTSGGTLGMSAPVSSNATVDPGSTPTDAETAKALFDGSEPVSVARWWAEHPDLAPADLANRVLLVDKPGTGPSRFTGPDMRKYHRVRMIITCATKAQYTVRLQVLDGLSIASSAGASCGGPALSSYDSPSLTSTARKTEVEVDVPPGTKYFVTVYGTKAT
jgi:hypothetical protein